MVGLGSTTLQLAGAVDGSSIGVGLRTLVYSSSAWQSFYGIILQLPNKNRLGTVIKLHVICVSGSFVSLSCYGRRCPKPQSLIYDEAGKGPVYTCKLGEYQSGYEVEITRF